MLHLTTPRQLLILDLDETLVYATDTPLESAPPCDFRGSSYAVWKRPFLDAFIATVLSWFDVAIWTASTEPYATAIVTQLFPAPNQLRFVWTRQRCTWHRHPEGAYDFWLKNLNKVKRCLRYPLERVLVIDDSAEKLTRHYGNLIAVRPFVGNMADTELHDLLPYLQWIRSVANVRTIDKRGWRTFRVPDLPDDPVGLL